jgi:hypothetical protein
MRRLTPSVGALCVAALCVAALGPTLARSEELRDPTRPPLPQSHAAAPREPAPVLSAVLTFNRERSAIFNGQLVHRGSVVGAYTIDSVLEDGVRYRHDSQWHELHLAHTASTVKKPAAEPARVPSGVH